MKHIFHKANDRLSDKEQWYLKKYLNESEELKRVYELKEAYRKWFLKVKEYGETNIKMIKQEQ